MEKLLGKGSFHKSAFKGKVNHTCWVVGLGSCLRDESGMPYQNITRQPLLFKDGV